MHIGQVCVRENNGLKLGATIDRSELHEDQKRLMFAEGGCVLQRNTTTIVRHNEALSKKLDDKAEKIT